MALSTGMRKYAGRVALAWVLMLSPAGLVRAESPSTSTISTPPVVTEVGGRTLAQWVAELKHADPSAREEAVRAITLFGPAASEAEPALLDRFQDSDASPRNKAVIAIGVLPKIDDKDRARVIEALGGRLAEDSQAMVRYSAAVSLAAMGPDAKGALPAVLRGMEDSSSWEIRRICIAALIAAGETSSGPDPRATHALLNALNDRAGQVRLEAVLALGNMGRPGDPVLTTLMLKALRNMESDKDKTVTIWAHLSIMALDKLDEADMDFLVRCSKPSELLRVRVQAVQALGAIGVKSKVVTPLLLDLLSDKEPNVVYNACAALGGLGKDAGPEVEKALAELGQNKDAEDVIKQVAAGALDNIKKAKSK